MSVPKSSVFREIPFRKADRASPRLDRRLNNRARSARVPRCTVPFHPRRASNSRRRRAAARERSKSKTLLLFGRSAFARRDQSLFRKLSAEVAFLFLQGPPQSQKVRPWR